jgi:hypothetical protein
MPIATQDALQVRFSEYREQSSPPTPNVAVVCWRHYLRGLRMDPSSDLDRPASILLLSLAWAEAVFGGLVVIMGVMAFRDEPVQLAGAISATGVALVVSGWALSTRRPHSLAVQLLVVLPWLVVRFF